MRRLAAALACRVGGRRLYGKPLQHLDIDNGVTILDHIVSVLKAIPPIDHIVLGIAEGRENEPFVDLAEAHGIDYIIGDEQDVLGRLIECGREVEATDIFRVTTECPFFLHEQIGEAFTRHVDAGNDVTVTDDLPEGGHFEIYTLEALERSHHLGGGRHRSELCSLYIREHRDDFQVEVLPVPDELRRVDLRLTVDYPEDLVFCRHIYEHFREREPLPSLSQIIAFLDENRHLQKLVDQYVAPEKLWDKDRLGEPQAKSAAAPVIAIVQARMRSTRLPGKVLADIAGRPMLEHVVERVSAATTIDRVVVATSTNPIDDVISAYCAEQGIDCFRGSESDVLDRYRGAAEEYGAGTIVRVTADCPLLDPRVLDRVVARLGEGGYDYAANVLSATYPDGLDVEAFSRDSLELAAREATSLADREHVTPYIRRSPDLHTAAVEQHADPRAGRMRWTVDEEVDLKFVRAVFDAHAAQSTGGELELPRINDGSPFGMADVMKLLERNPELMSLNQGIARNEGYYHTIAEEPPIPPSSRTLSRSHALLERARRVIPSATQTFSKGPTQYVEGVSPAFLERGSGCHVWDVDGNEYIDHMMALGPLVLGHNFPAVSEAVVRQMQDGSTFTLPHALEVDVSELLVETIPGAEMVRFGKNGSDVTSGAVRVARAFTGRDVIAVGGYHGWQDWFIGSTTRDAGVPAAVSSLTAAFLYNDISSLEHVFTEHPGDVAAVILEPIGVEEPRDGFLEAVRELTEREGAVLIFDELLTGFRLALGGAQEYFSVTADLACFGKAMGNGYPIAAVTGRREIMELFDEVFFSFTFGGETLSLAAARETIIQIREREVIAHLWAQGEKLSSGFNALARHFGLEQHAECVGLAPHTVMLFRSADGAESLDLKSLFQQECAKRGVLFGGGHNPSLSHTDADIDHTLRVYRATFEVLAKAIEGGVVEQALEGPPIQAVFRQP